MACLNLGLSPKVKTIHCDSSVAIQRKKSVSPSHNKHHQVVVKLTEAGGPVYNNKGNKMAS